MNEHNPYSAPDAPPQKAARKRSTLASLAIVVGIVVACCVSFLVVYNVFTNGQDPRLNPTAPAAR